MDKAKVLAAVLAVSASGLAGITYFEGSVKTVYLDPVNIPTVCVGHIKTVTRKDVGKTYSQATCDYLLKQDSADAQNAVRKLVKVPVTQDQFDGLTSFVFNVGENAFAHSALLRKANAGDCRGAGAEFERWVLAKGQKLPGLVTRRQWESRMWLSGC